MAFMCSRCLADVRPKHFGDDRKCAFGANGQFVPDNWNCATLDALMNTGRVVHVYGQDEAMSVVPAAFDDGGFIVLTRYKTRGKTSGLVWVGDWPKPRKATIGLVLAAISGGPEVDDDQH